MNNLERRSFNGIILKSVDTDRAGKKLLILTDSIGLVTIFVPQARRPKNGSGFFIPTAIIHGDIIWQNNCWQLSQVRGELVADVLSWEYETWECYYCVVECLEQLFPEEILELELFALIRGYIRSLDGNGKKTLSLIACWQIFDLAGYNPQVVFEQKIERNRALTLKKVLNFRLGEDQLFEIEQSDFFILSKGLLEFAQNEVDFYCKRLRNVFLDN